MDHSYSSESDFQSSSELFQERNTYDVTDQKVKDASGVEGTYTGSVDAKTEEPHGEGRMEYASETYDGQWIDGDRSGFGTLSNQDTGDVYEGGFFDNMRHGNCILKYGDGKIYDGTFQFNAMGKGKMTYLDGSTFWGYYNSNTSLPHGRGKFAYPDGSVYDGEFDNGVIQGHGRMTWKDGRYYLGEWSNGEKNGLGIEVRGDGSICHEGAFSNGTAVTGSSFARRRRSNESCILYPNSVTLGRTSTLIGPIPQRRRSAEDYVKLTKVPLSKLLSPKRCSSVIPRTDIVGSNRSLSEPQ